MYLLLPLHVLISCLLHNLYNSMKVFVYTDGWSRWNPGIAGCWVYITDVLWNPLERRFKFIGIATNNIAEYTAALLGIERAVTLGATDITLHADSQLAIEQLKGNYKVKNPELKKLYLQIQEIIEQWWGNISFEHIPREQNKEADRLSNVAMDKHGD
jgi:ribonuclease HI